MQRLRPLPPRPGNCCPRAKLLKAKHDTSRMHVSFAQNKNPQQCEIAGGFLTDKCLTMTYFHRRTSTIIGAKAFHGPVRDGKEWDHLAMVVKRNRVPASAQGAGWPIWEEAHAVRTVWSWRVFVIRAGGHAAYEPRWCLRVGRLTTRLCFV